MNEVISFDLQGTLSDATFSDEFWSETLPILYSERMKITLDEAREVLCRRFNKWGRYDSRYYSMEYWMGVLGIKNPDKMMGRILNMPLFYSDTIDLLKTLGKKLIIMSSTTYEFIDIEMGENKRFFSQIYSSLDDFGIAGKPPDFYLKVAQEINTPPEKILHIGDGYEMDIMNAEKAGLKTFYFDRNRKRQDVLKELKDILVDMQ